MRGFAFSQPEGLIIWDKTRHLDIFTVSSWIGTGDPTVEKVNLKITIWPKKCARMPQIC